jgi:hypothetical protein
MAEEGFRITYATMTADNEDLHKATTRASRSRGRGSASSIRCS